MKVLFFTAGSIPTQGELDAIAALQDSVVSLEVGVRSGVTPDGGSLETADYAAGTIPTAYNALPAWPGVPPVPEGYAVVEDQQALEVPVTGTYTNTATVTVEDGVVTAIVLS